MSFDFKFTPQQLRQIIGNSPHVSYWHHAICEICPEYQINTAKRLAAFLAQCAHESSHQGVGFARIRENLNYRAESLVKTFPRYFPDLATANKYAHNPEMIANRAYANRMGNRNEASGDGWRYLGRGLIQLTGKENYMWFAASLGMDVIDVPEYLETFEGAVQGACFFWELNGLNTEADAGDIRTMTKKINGGYHGLEDRIKRYAHALNILGV